MIHPILTLFFDVGEHSMVHSKNCDTMKLWLTDWQCVGRQHQEACYTCLQEKTMKQRKVITLPFYLYNERITITKSSRLDLILSDAFYMYLAG